MKSIDLKRTKFYFQAISKTQQDDKKRNFFNFEFMFSDDTSDKSRFESSFSVYIRNAGYLEQIKSSNPNLQINFFQNKHFPSGFDCESYWTCFNLDYRLQRCNSPTSWFQRTSQTCRIPAEVTDCEVRKNIFYDTKELIRNYFNLVCTLNFTTSTNSTVSFSLFYFT